MADIQIFDNVQFGPVRWLKIEYKDFAVGVDVAKALGYKNPNDAIVRHCRGYVKHAVPTNSGEQIMNVISEGDIYRLIAGSQLPAAEKFESWIFDEVLPTIRKHGAYMTDNTIEKALTDPDFLIKLATNLKEERAARLAAETKVQALTPKAVFYDDVAGSKDAIEMAHVAKVLSIKGYGRNNLFDFLREKKVLDKDNIPYQRFVDCGYFRVLEQKYKVPSGETKINIKTLVFQKGVEYIRKLIKEGQA